MPVLNVVGATPTSDGERSVLAKDTVIRGHGDPNTATSPVVLTSHMQDNTTQHNTLCASDIDLQAELFPLS